jgi:broad specificity phosphatase PhoE
MQLLIARHAETAWNVEKRIQGWTNSNLTRTGTHQAQALAERMRTLKLTAIYSSDAQRALRTAECVALWHNVDVTPIEDLRETGWGEWEGMTADEIAERFPDLWNRFVARGQDMGADDSDWETTTLVPGGECVKDCSERIGAVLSEIRRVHTGDTERILLVGHGGSLRYFFTHALGVRPALARRFHLDNTSLSEVSFAHDHPPVIRLLNDVSHLASVTV